MLDKWNNSVDLSETPSSISTNPYIEVSALIEFVNTHGSQLLKELILKEYSWHTLAELELLKHHFKDYKLSGLNCTSHYNVTEKQARMLNQEISSKYKELQITKADIELCLDYSGRVAFLVTNNSGSFCKQILS